LLNPPDKLRGCRLDPISDSATVSQIGNPALVEREAVTLPLDNAFGFELTDVGPAAIEVLRQRDALTVAGLLDRGREAGLAADGRPVPTALAIVFARASSR